jgi:hypothetical protein
MTEALVVYLEAAGVEEVETLVVALAKYLALVEQVEQVVL